MAEPENLPEYANPPIVEMVVGVQFERLPAFLNSHLGAFWLPLSKEWPELSDAPPIAMQFERFGDRPRWNRNIQLSLTKDVDVRLRAKNAALDRMIQIQNGRFHLNWLGLKGQTYPRYSPIRDEFLTILESLKSFLSENEIGEFRPNQWEVTYVNHIPRGTVWNTYGNWGFFRPLGNVGQPYGIDVCERGASEWTFRLPEDTGRLHVQFETRLENDEEIVRLSFTARGPLPEKTKSPILDGLDLGRRSIVFCFRDLMSDEANAHFGLNNE